MSDEGTCVEVEERVYQQREAGSRKQEVGKERNVYEYYV
jgi:hypothetical protein